MVNATCPECHQGKHLNCTIHVLVEADDLTERFDPCACHLAGHTPPTPKE